MRETTAPAHATAPVHAARGDGFTTSGMWFGPTDRLLAGWWSAPGQPSCRGVVIAPPLGYEYWSCYRSLRTFAESLARAGWHTLRFDWDGTGNSGGAADDPLRVSAWRSSLASAVAAMRNAGVQHIALAGVRLGATLALLDAAALGVDAVIACAPATSGKRWLRELKMLGVVNPEEPGTMTYSGLVIDTATAEELAAIDLVKQPPPAAKRTLLVTRSEAADASFIRGMCKQDHVFETHPCESMQRMLDAAAGEDTLPDNFVEPIIRWLGKCPTCETGAQPSLNQTADVTWSNSKILATFTRIEDLAAICTHPLDREPDTVVVFLNSGADPHVGPGRAWVEYSRELALRGYACVRADFTAFGESQDDNRPPGRPYDPHCLDDTLKMVAVLRRRYQRVVLAGLCVGAWIALRAALVAPIDGVFALNPLLWWKPGLPIILRIPDTVAWRAPMRARGQRLAKFRVWSLLDAIAIRPMASRWLMTLRRRRIPVMLSYAEDDDGLTYLRNRCSRRVARELRHGLLTLEEVPGIDHPMFRLWRRHVIIEQMLRFLASLPSAEPAR